MSNARERETARDIVSMLKAAEMTMTNTREGHPLHSYRRNHYGPGILYAVDLIERAFHLRKPEQE